MVFRACSRQLFEKWKLLLRVCTSKRWFLIHKYFILHLLIFLPCKTYCSRWQLLKFIFTFGYLYFYDCNCHGFIRVLQYCISEDNSQESSFKKKESWRIPALPSATLWQFSDQCLSACQAGQFHDLINSTPEEKNPMSSNWKQCIWVRPPSRSLISMLPLTWAVFYTGNAFR